MIKAILLFILGLVLLIKGGDWFVDGATKIAKRFNIPDLLIGATVVSIGTTLPEVMVSSASAFSGHGQMAFGNAIGSIICNTALIAAITMAVKPAKVDKKTLTIPTVFFLMASFVYFGVAYTTGNFTRPVGIILLVICGLYIIVNVRSALANKGISGGADNEDTADEKDSPLWKNFVALLAGAAFIAVGADLLVDNGIIIAEALGVPETVIAITFIALGTSLPELVTAITSLSKGHGSLSVGNICGANIFNLVLVSGASVTIGPFSLKDAGFATTTIGGHEIYKSLLVDSPLAIAVMLIMLIPAIIKGELKRWQGVLLLCLYVGFCIYQFVG